MPSYRDLMPDLSPIQSVISRLTDFTLPSNELRQYGTRAAQEAATAAQTGRTSLQNVRRSLDQQRSAALNALQARRGLLPQLFSQNLQSAVQQARQQESQRGAFDSGLRLRNILEAGASPLQQQTQSLQQIGAQQAQTEKNYLQQLLSQVLQPERELAAQQGADAVRRYQTYVQEAQSALYQGRVNEAEALLTAAQHEYNALIAAEENRLLRQQAQYQRRLNAEQSRYSNTSSSSRGAASGAYSSIINKYAEQYGVNPGLVSRVIQAESSGNPRARSHAGAMGLMQLMPATARSLGVRNAYDPDQNIRGGTQYLAQQLRRWNENEALALASYNAGPGRVQQAVRRAGSQNWNAVRRYLPRETQNYVAKILGR